jgi:hypothetical protein
VHFCFAAMEQSNRHLGSDLKSALAPMLRRTYPISAAPLPDNMEQLLARLGNASSPTVAPRVSARRITADGMVLGIAFACAFLLAIAVVLNSLDIWGGPASEKAETLRVPLPAGPRSPG